VLRPASSCPVAGTPSRAAESSRRPCSATMEDGWLTPGVWSSRSRSERSSKDAPALDAPRAKLIALACTRPPETEQGLRRERWTYRELGDAVGLSESHAHRILAAGEIRPHLTGTGWCPSLGPTSTRRPPRSAVSISTRPRTRSSSRSTRRPESRPRGAPRRHPSARQARPARQRVRAQRNPEPLRGASGAFRRGLGDGLQDAQPL